MDTAQLDKQLQRLQGCKDKWVKLPIPKKIEYLEQIRENTERLGHAWVEASVKGKQIDPNSPWVGEEWISGVWAFIEGSNGITKTLRAIEKGEKPELPKVTTRPDGQVLAHVFPTTFFDKLLLSGYQAEIWMEPDVTLDNLEQNMAAYYDRENLEGKVALVLGAGNISAITPLDILFKLYTEIQVVIVKMNPVNDYLGSIYEEIFAGLIEDSFVEFAYGGVDVGEHLVNHDLVDEIHLTGSITTFERIVFGFDEKAMERKKNNLPRMKKRITSELGGVGPAIIVPGPWTKADIKYQAERLATIKFHHSGFNCVASQILILPESWDKSEDLLDALRQQIKNLPPREPYYPGAEERYKKVIEIHPDAETFGDGHIPRTLITGLDPNAEDEYAFNNEFFGPIYGQTSLPGNTAEEFLNNAVEFANEKVFGTLGVTVLIHPKTIKELGSKLGDAIAKLRYGAIGVNIWDGGAFLLGQAAWGSYPGNPLNDVKSGQGFVHNSFMFDKPQKTVVYGNFYNYPRNMLYGEYHLSPRPVWFVTNPTADETGKRIAHFALSPGWGQVPGLFLSALRGAFKPYEYKG